MAEFRKLFYALGVAALFTGLSSTASAQQGVTCTASAASPLIRGEGFTELVGDYRLDCTGGVATTNGIVVPQINITITINAPITSRLLASSTVGGAWSEALLIIDEPNSSVNPARPLLACGATGAPDNGPNGRNVCNIVAPLDPTQTYNGATGVAGSTGPLGTDGACDGGDPDLVTVNNVTTDGAIPARPANNTSYGCGRPNVFQGRQALGQTNAIVFAGVPFNPPGTVDSGPQPVRTLRFTNFRVAPQNFAAGSFVLPQITMSININAAMPITIIGGDKTVASVTSGISLVSSGTPQNFVQCNTVTAGNLNAGNTRPVIFREGFETSFKTRGLEEIVGTSATNGVANNGNGVFSGGAWRLNTSATAFVASDQGTRQNIPGAVYNTESGFTAAPSPTQVPFSSTGSPVVGQNPPFGFGYSFAVTGDVAGISNSTGISFAGIATQGTRIAVRFADLPRGITLVIPNTVYLYQQGDGPNGTGVPTGVAVRTATGSHGDGLFTPGTAFGSFNLTTTTGLVVYEVLFSQPSVKEDFYFPVNVAYTPQLSSNLPDVTVTTLPTASGGFAPFIDLSQDSAAVWGNAIAATASVTTTSLPIPRFRPLGTDTLALFTITKCSCNLLFPFVTNFNTGRGNYDTGVAIANTSLLPTAASVGGGFNALGFATGTAQQGPVQLWYYPADPADASKYTTQCTNSTVNQVCPGTKDVLPGGTLTFSISAGNPSFGIAPRPGFTGYMVAQTGFQYCHSFAYISAQGAAPADAGMSVGYVALQLDTPRGQIGPRTLTAGEHLNQ